MFKQLITILLLILATLSISFSQKTSASIDNVDFVYNEENEKIVVTYDISQARKFERFEISLRFMDVDGNVLNATSLKGDIGKYQEKGYKKHIEWDVFKDTEQLTGKIKAVVDVKSVYAKFKGPEAALYSLVVPGLGDYMVADSKKMIIKPYFKTILAFGLVGYGMYQRNEANKYYDDYSKIIDRPNSFDPRPDNYLELWDNAQGAKKQYYIASSLGAAIWLSDIIWVAVKGTRNLKNNRKHLGHYNHQGSDLNLAYDGKHVYFRYNINF